MKIQRRFTRSSCGSMVCRLQVINVLVESSADVNLGMNTLVEIEVKTPQLRPSLDRKPFLHSFLRTLQPEQHVSTRSRPELQASNHRNRTCHLSTYSCSSGSCLSLYCHVAKAPLVQIPALAYVQPCFRGIGSKFWGVVKIGGPCWIHYIYCIQKET